MLTLLFSIKFLSLIVIFLSLFTGYPSSAQDLKVTNKRTYYQELVNQDSLQKMIELKSLMPGIVYEIHYATKANFTGKRLYKKGNQTFLRLPAAQALVKVQKELSIAGYELKIWDAYRPYSITRKMWDMIGDERYVANPSKGSGHNRGLAVDLTLLKDGKEINMGTSYDNFSDTAHHSFTMLSNEVLRNRQLLKTTMEKYGFKALETEWWHYSYANDRKYDVLDLTFKELARKR